MSEFRSMFLRSLFRNALFMVPVVVWMIGFEIGRVLQ